MKIIVSNTYRKLSTLLSGLSGKDLQKVVSRSIKKTLPTVRKFGVQTMKAQNVVRATSTELKNAFKLYDNARASSPIAEQSGKIWVVPKQLSLARFYATKAIVGNRWRGDKPMAKGQGGFNQLTFTLNSAGSPFWKSNQFMIQKKSGGGPQIFARISGSRLPIEKQLGDGVATLVEKSNILPSMAQVASIRYNENFDHEMKFQITRALQKAKGKK